MLNAFLMFCTMHLVETVAVAVTLTCTLSSLSTKVGRRKSQWEKISGILR